MAAEKQGLLVEHPAVSDTHPEVMARLLCNLSTHAAVREVCPDRYGDRTPRLRIPDVAISTGTAVIPGFISGIHAEDNLIALTKTGHALRFPHPTDSRTPWVDHVHYLLTDAEGRGDKPTTDKVTGALIEPAELHYAYYIAEMLRGPGRGDSYTILDPHDREGVRALGKPVTVITALRECATYMRENGLLPNPEDGGIVIPDNGSIGRSLFLSWVTGLPILARFLKKRLNGGVHIVGAYGTENIADKDILLGDDVIATGDTFFADGNEIRAMGARSLTGMITHAKGVQGTRENFIARQQEHVFDTFLITNSTPYCQDFEGIPDAHIVDIVPLMTRAAMAVLSPTAANKEALRPDIFPLADSQTYLRWLYREYPGLVSNKEAESLQLQNRIFAMGKAVVHQAGMRLRR